VSPSLHVDHRSARIRQYHRESRAPRTETVIDDADDLSALVTFRLQPAGFSAGDLRRHPQRRFQTSSGRLRAIR
jgi:hypothetical protein